MFEVGEGDKSLQLQRFLQFVHEGLIPAVSSEQLMLRCVCYLNSVKHLFGLPKYGLGLLSNRAIFTTLLIDSNALRRKTIPQINF